MDPCPINCRLSQWTEWTVCDAQCGGGRRGRTREVEVAPAHGGKACEHTHEMINCNTETCGVLCEMSEWGPWSECESERKCGNGVQSRSREIIRAGVPPKVGYILIFSLWTPKQKQQQQQTRLNRRLATTSCRSSNPPSLQPLCPSEHESRGCALPPCQNKLQQMDARLDELEQRSGIDKQIWLEQEQRIGRRGGQRQQQQHQHRGALHPALI